MASEPMSQSESLKPCPFCGGNASPHARPPYGYPRVMCDVCLGRMSAPTIEEAIAAWNRRPSTADRGGEVEVKALEWEQHEQTYPGDRSKFFWRAKTAWGGFLWIEMHYSAFMYEGRCIFETKVFNTVEAAKAAAQADYTARIRSALATTAGEATQTVPVEPTEAMLDAYWHQAGESKEMRQRVHHSARCYWQVMLAAALVTDKG